LIRGFMNGSKLYNFLGNDSSYFFLERLAIVL